MYSIHYTLHTQGRQVNTREDEKYENFDCLGWCQVSDGKQTNTKANVQTVKGLYSLQKVKDEKSFTLYKRSRMRKALLFTRGRG